jgi:ribosomal protein L37E
MTDKKLFWTAVNLLNDIRGFTAVVDYCDELYADGVQGLTKEDCDKCGEEYHFHGQCVMCETYNTPEDRRRHNQWEERFKKRNGGIDSRGRINLK